MGPKWEMGTFCLAYEEVSSNYFLLPCTLKPHHARESAILHSIAGFNVGWEKDEENNTRPSLKIGNGYGWVDFLKSLFPSLIRQRTPRTFISSLIQQPFTQTCHRLSYSEAMGPLHHRRAINNVVSVVADAPVAICGIGIYGGRDDEVRQKLS